MNGLMDELDGWMNGRMDGRADGWKKAIFQITWCPVEINVLESGRHKVQRRIIENVCTSFVHPVIHSFSNSCKLHS